MEHNTAFVFPGQGSQYAGMGRDVAEKYPVAHRVFDDIDRALGFSISKLCFEGDPACPGPLGAFSSLVSAGGSVRRNR